MVINNQLNKEKKSKIFTSLDFFGIFSYKHYVSYLELKDEINLTFGKYFNEKNIGIYIGYYYIENIF